jgi:sulfate permease, SulP family
MDQVKFNPVSAVFAGIISGIVTLTYSVSYAALIFNGNLSPFYSVGISVALISAALIAFIVAMGSSFSFSIAGPDSNASAILALMANAMAVSLAADPSAMVSTVIAAIAFSSVIVGVFLFTVGKLKLGYFVRFIPYPVLGGFLAGTGWLITTGAFMVMTGESFGLDNLKVLYHFEHIKHWAPGLMFVVIVMFITSKIKHYLTFPSLLLLAIVVTHVAIYMSGMSLTQASVEGWLYKSFENKPSLNVWASVSFDSIQWGLIWSQMGNILAMIAVVIITILLNATGIELTSKRDANLNKELSSAGVANVVTGLCGGMIGYLSISRSMLNYKAGGIKPMSGICAALFCMMIFVFGASFLSYLPKLVLGGLLLYLGVGLLKEWVIDAFFKLSKIDYFLVIAILVVIATAGFLEGVSFGVLISVVLFVVNYSRIDIVQHELSGSNHRSSFVRSMPEQTILNERGGAMYILNLQGYLFFGTANNLLERVKQKIKDEGDKIKYVILDFRLVTGLDSSVTLSFTKIHQVTSEAGIKIFLTHLDSSISHHFEDAKLVNDKDFRLFPTLDHCVQWCEDELIETYGSGDISASDQFQDQLKTMFLEPDQTNNFMNYLKCIKEKKGSYIMRQGDPADSMYFVSSGVVTALLDLPDKQIRLISMGSGTVFGEMGLYTNAPRTAAIVADEDTVLFELNREQLEKMQKEQPEMATSLHYFIISLLAERIALSNKKVQMLY